MIDKATTLIDQCPDCKGDIQIPSSAYIGRLLTCPHCQAGLQVAGLSPFRVSWYDDVDDLDDDDAFPTRTGSASRPRTGATRQAKESSGKGAKPDVATCPECQATVRLKKVKKAGQTVTCRECDRTLTVVSLKPLQLDWLGDEPEVKPYEAQAQKKKPTSLRVKNHKSDMFDPSERGFYD